MTSVVIYSTRRRIGLAACIFLMAAPSFLYAQSIRLVNPSTMEFNDPTYSVSFRFPASWTYSTQPAFIDPPTIIGPPDYNSDIIPLRGSAFTKELAGDPSSPPTALDGVQFSYAVREQTTPDDCRFLALSANPEAAVQEVTLNGQTFHHSSGSGVGGGHGEEEEIFTVSQGTGCLLFDMSGEFSSGADSPPRAFTSQEAARIHAALMEVFKSVKISQPSAPTESAFAGGAKEFVDPQFPVRFRYPASWSFSTVPQFDGPEAVLTAPAANTDAGFSARAIVFEKKVAGSTALSGADFIFNVVPGQSLESCRDYLEQSRNLNHISTRPVGGMPVFYATTGAAGMCHQVNEAIYFHLAGGECYFFDLALHSICTPEGGRDASPDEMRAVRYQLQSILDSVALREPLQPAAPRPHP